MTDKPVRWERGDDGIVVVTLDAPGRSANTMNDAYRTAMGECVDALVADREDINGVIITSAKKTFFAGGDLAWLSSAGPDDAPAVMAQSMEIKSQFRKLETLGRPVVAAMNGTALGGGLEIGLACHHRIGLDAKGVVYGLPEVTLGLLPGAGGVVRITRMLGIQDGFMKVLAQGQRHKPAAALEIGIVDELAAVARGDDGRGPGLDRREPRRGPALGPAGLPDPRRHPVHPEAGRGAAGVPGQPAQAAQGRPAAGAAEHPGRGRGGHPGRHRHRVPDRGPLLHRAGLRAGLEEHDQGVLLRPAAHQLAAAPGRTGTRAARRARSPCSAPG